MLGNKTLYNAILMFIAFAIGCSNQVGENDKKNTVFNALNSCKSKDIEKIWSLMPQGHKEFFDSEAKEKGLFSGQESIKYQIDKFAEIANYLSQANIKYERSVKGGSQFLLYNETNKKVYWATVVQENGNFKAFAPAWYHYSIDYDGNRKSFIVDSDLMNSDFDGSFISTLKKVPRKEREQFVTSQFGKTITLIGKVKNVKPGGFSGGPFINLDILQEAKNKIEVAVYLDINYFASLDVSKPESKAVCEHFDGSTAIITSGKEVAITGLVWFVRDWFDDSSLLLIQSAIFKK